MNIFFKKGLRTLFSMWIALAALMSATEAWADGSADMYPSTATGTYRAALIGGTFQSSLSPYVNNGCVKVYAKYGETLYLATSAFARSNDSKPHIDWRAPDGSSGTFYKNGTIGCISNRTQELAGPKLNESSSSDCYEAYTIVVGKDQEGVWEIDFNTGSVTCNSQISQYYKVNDWSEYSNSAMINAFDVSVLNVEGTAFVKGRVYLNVLNIYICPGGNYDEPWNTQFYILTNSGYLYYMNTNGMNPCMASFFVNNKGVQTGGVSESGTYVASMKGGTPTL